jgi:hypothetical protein
MLLLLDVLSAKKLFCFFLRFSDLKPVIICVAQCEEKLTFLSISKTPKTTLFLINEVKTNHGNRSSEHLENRPQIF